MPEELKKARRVVGVKQSEKAVSAGNVEYVYVAADAHERVTAPFVDVCKRCGVEVRTADSMVALGRACGIDVGAAVVAVLK